MTTLISNKFSISVTINTAIDTLYYGEAWEDIYASCNIDLNEGTRRRKRATSYQALYKWSTQLDTAYFDDKDVVRLYT